MSYMPAIVSNKMQQDSHRLIRWAVLSLALHGLVIGWALLHVPLNPTSTATQATIQVQLIAAEIPKTVKPKHRQPPQPLALNKPAPPPAPSRQHRQTVVEQASTSVPQPPLPANPPASQQDEQLPVKFTRILHAAIDQQKHYPLAALRMRQQGTARIRFRLFEDGRVEEITLLKTSGYQSLDRSALLAVQNIAPFTPAREYLHDDKQFFVDIVFRI